jgi:hypothetical protein
MPVTQELDRTKTMETWEITVPGRVWVTTTVYNRYGQPVDKPVSLGPNKVGQRLKISVADREANQELCERPELDPFLNGLLVRVAGGDPADESVASTDALTSAELSLIFDKNGNAFHAAVDALGEIPVRRLLALCDAVDATAKQKAYIEQVINERFRNPGSSQGTGSAVFNLAGERVGSDGTPYEGDED